MTILRLLPVLLLAACATQSAMEESKAYARLGEYARAYVILDELRSETLANGGTVDAELETAHRQAHMAFLLYRAEERVFQEHEDAALADLVELQAMQSDYPGIEGVRSRAKLKKARRMAHHGEECLLSKDYVNALASFLESESLVPGLEEVQEGIKEVGLATARLSSRAQEQFLEAVRKLPDFRFVEVQWHASNVIHNTPERDEARMLETKARRENAQTAMTKGRSCERQGKFGAALLEYKLAKRIDKDVPGVDAAIEAMGKEQKATGLMDSAQTDMRVGRFDAARAKLGEAFELSVMARNEIGAAVLQCKKLEGTSRYQAGRDFEVLGKKQEALVAYEALAKDWPAGFSDESARIAGLRVDIEGAAKEWTEAEAAEAANDLPAALDHYINSERFYGGWKDGKQRIARLRAATTPPPAGGGQNGSQGNSSQGNSSQGNSQGG